MPVSRVELLQFPALISFMSHVTAFNFIFQEVKLFLSALKINPLEFEIKINFVTGRGPLVAIIKLTGVSRVEFCTRQYNAR